MDNLIQGLVDAIMPRYLNAREQEDKAKKELEKIKSDLLKIITTPQTITTTWGKIIRKKGNRKITVTCDKTKAEILALKAQIKILEETAVKNGGAVVSINNDYIEFRGN